MIFYGNKKRINDLIFGRILVIIAIQIFLLFYSFIHSGLMGKEQFNLLTIINVFSLLCCIMAFKTIDKGAGSRLFNVLLTLFDSSYLVVLIALTGYDNSPFILILPLYIFFTTLMFKTVGTVFSTFLSIGLIVAGYSLTRNPAANTSYVITISSVIVFFALVTGHLIDKTTKAGRDIKEFNKLSKLLIDNLELGIINVNRKGFISSINSTAEKVFKDRDNILLMLDDLVKESDTGSHRIELEGNILLFIYKVDTSHGYTLVIKDISNEDKADKLKLINTIAAVLAHEIKNPVSSISGVSELIRTDNDILSNKDQKDKLLGIIDRESTRLTNLVEEFLIYSGSEKRKNEEININAIIRNTCDNIRVNKEFLEKGLNLELKANNDKDSIICGDFHRLSQAMDNVFINAVQACGKNGNILCTVKNSNGSINVMVNDTGVGIPDNVKNRIFEPFFTTKEKGTGLGLAIVNNIILAHGGDIEVKQNDPGTTFNITFPKNRSN